MKLNYSNGLISSQFSSAKNRWLSLFLSLFGLFAGVIFATTLFASPLSGATLTSDEADYPPGSTVILSGTGFSPGETVTMQVVHADGDPINGDGHDPWDVTADQNGAFVTTWYVPFDDNVDELLLATADGQSSGIHAETTFTDSNTRLTLTGLSDGDSFCPGGEGDSIRVCAELVQRCTQQSSMGLANRPVIFFVNPGNCGVDISQVGDTVYTDEAGIACYTIPVPVIEGQYSIRAKFLREIKPHPCPNPGNSACVSLLAQVNKECVTLSASNDCRSFFVDAGACFNPPPLFCAPDTSLSLCGPEEVCLYPFTGGITDSGSLTTNIGELRNDSLCFTPDTSGVYTITLVRSDVHGVDSCSSQVTVDINSPPQIVGADGSVYHCLPQTLTTHQLSSLDEDFDQLSWTLLSGAGSIDETGLISFLPDTSGQYCFDVMLSDGCASDVQEICLNVTINREPEMYEYSDTIKLCGADSVCFTVAGFDRDLDDQVVITQVGGPGIFSMTTDTSGVTCFAVGAVTAPTTYDFYYEITDDCIRLDSAGYYNELYQWHISITVLPNNEPTITLGADQTISACGPVEICVPVDFADTDGNLLALDASIGLYDDSLGSICFTGSGSTADTLIVTAVDSCGSSAVDTAIITYIQPNALAIDCPVDTDVFICEEDTVCVPFGQLDPDWQLTVKPASVSYDPATGNLCFFTNCSVSKQITTILSNGCDTDTCVFTVDVTMNQAPFVVTARTADTLFCEPGQLCIPAGVSDNDDNVASYQSSHGTYNPTIGRICLDVTEGGEFDVIFSATDACGATSYDTTHVIAAVNRTPEIVAGADFQLDLCAPQPVCVSFIASDPDGARPTVSANIGSYDSLAKLICFTPDTSGVYAVIGTATDQCGDSASDTAYVTIRFNETPQISLGSDSSVFLCAIGEICVPVTIPDVFGNSNLATVTPDFGVYNPVAKTLCFTPSDAGEYQLIVTATDLCGAQAFDTINISVSIGDLASIQCPVEPLVYTLCGESVITYTLSVTPANAPVSVSAGSYANGILTLPVDTSGEYHVTAITTTECSADTCDLVFDVTIGESVAFDCPTDTSLFLCQAGAQISVPVGLIANSAEVTVAPIGVYLDGFVTFIADTAGQYRIALSALTDCGSDSCEVVADVSFNSSPTITAANDTALFLCGRSSYCLPFTASDIDGNLSSTSSSIGEVFGDSVCLTFDEPGDYAVVLTATDSCGASATDSVVISVTMNSAPSLTLGDDLSLTLCADTTLCLPFELSDLDGNVASVTTSLGEISGSTVCITTSGSGTYIATVTATDSCGLVSSDQISVTVTVNTAPQASLTAIADTALCAPAELCVPITFSDDNLLSLVASGGTLDSALGSICFTPESSGTYVIGLTATDSCGLETYKEVTVNVTVNSAPVVNSAADTLITTCDAGTVCFDVSVSDIDDNLLATNVSGGTNAFYNEGTVCFDPDSSGIYRIITTVNDSCGLSAEDTTVVTVVINSAPSVTLAEDTVALQCVSGEYCVPFEVFDIDNNIESISSSGARYDVNSGSVCFTPSVDGYIEVIVTVTDSCGLSAADTTVFWVNNGDNFTLTCPTDTALFICEPDTLCFPLTGIPVDAEVQINLNSAWYNSETETICFYTNCSVVKDIEVIVVNGCYVDTCTFRANVTMNSAPLVIAAPDTAALICSAQDICLPVGISDGDDNIDFVQVSPAGSYNPIAGNICVPVDTSGVYLVTITAFDSCGATDMDSVYINVGLNRAPHVNDAEDFSVFLCAPEIICIPASVGDPDGNIRSISVTGADAVYDQFSDRVCFMPGPTGGAYTLITTALDACGAVGADTTTVTVVINQAPQISLQSESYEFLCASGEICVPVDISDVDGNLLSVSVSPGAWYDEANGTLCFIAANSGDFVVEVTAIDSCGTYTTTSTTVHLTINSAPVVATSVDTTLRGCSLQEVCFAVGVSDAEDNFDPANVSVSPFGSYDPISGMICLTPQDTGMLAVIVSITDSCGATGADTTWVVAEIEPPVSIECPVIPISAFICDSDTICQAVTISPNYATVEVSYGWFENGVLCFPADTAGFYQIDIVATGPCSVDSCRISFNVTQGNAPQFSCPTDTAMFLCQAGAVCRPVGSMPSAATVTVLPSGSYSAGQVCFDADTSGRYEITVIADSDCGGDTCSFFVDITINSAPVVADIQDQSALTCDIGNERFCYPVSISDVDGNLRTVAVPTFAEYDFVNNEICFTPSSAGDYTLFVQAVDSCGATGIDTFTVTVAVDSVPVISCPEPIDFEFCATGEYCFPIEVNTPSAVLTIAGLSDAVIRNDSLCFTMDTSGSYSATIVATTDCGADTCVYAINGTRLPDPTLTCPTDTTLFSCQPDTICLPFDFSPEFAFVSVNGPAFVDQANKLICIPVTTDTTMTLTLRSDISCSYTECTFTVTTDLNDAPVVALGGDLAEFQCDFDSICIPVSLIDDEDNIASVTTNLGAYNSETGVVCFLPPTIGLYSIEVTAVDTCGAVGKDTVNVTITTGVKAEIICPQGVQSASLCGPDQVCLLVPVTDGVDSTVTSIGSYNPATKKLCFVADTAGIYSIDVIAYAPCGNDTCEVTVSVEITPTPTLSCPDPIDTLVCVSQTDSIWVQIGTIAQGSEVIVKPVGRYADGYVGFPVDTLGNYEIDVLASTRCGADSCRLNITVRDNQAPDLTTPTTLSIPHCETDTGLICVSGIFANDAEGDPLTISKICGPGELTLIGDNTAQVCFDPINVDSTYEFCVQVSDGCHTRTESFFVTVHPSNDCGVCLTTWVEGPECSPVGLEVTVDIMTQTKDQIGGYDLLITYDPSATAFMFAEPGDAITGWEYFTYRQGPFGNCLSGCPSGMLRLVAIADVNNGSAHPPGESLQPQGSLASIRFRISNDQSLGNQFVPINFHWLDCGDNAFSDPGGQLLFIDSRIFNAENSLIWDENDDSRYPEGARPLGLGAPDNPCLEGDKSQPVRCVDFVNGGICIIDPDSIDARGDINLNGISYEVADAVVLTNYFIVGVSAFVFSVAGQTAASDVNADGATLTVSDLVYLIRVLIGDAAPIPKVIPGLQSDVTATLSQVGADYAISTYAETRLGAALFTFEYDGVGPEEITLAEGADGMNLRYSVENGKVRVLIYDDPAGPSGAFIDIGDNPLLNVTMPAGAGELRLIEAEMSDYQGWQVINANVKTAVLPTEFSLAQNYPNPFNPATNIELSLPQKSDWQITVFNMLGQKVRQFEGASEAGIVTVRWNGKDKNGSSVASGLYLYRAKAGAFSATRKMMLLK